MTGRCMNFLVRDREEESGRLSHIYKLDLAFLILVLAIGMKKDKLRMILIVVIMATAIRYWRQWLSLPWIFSANFQVRRYSLKGVPIHAPGFIKWGLLLTIWRSMISLK